MKLKDYIFKLSRHPHASKFQPFKDWGIHRATGSIPWYDAYKKVKHDRKQNFH